MFRVLTLTLLLCASIRAAVHRIDVVHHQPINEPIDDRESRAQLAAKHMALLTDIATKEPITAKEYYGYNIVGNMSLGSPAQPFLFNFDFWSPNLYVIDSNATIHDYRNASNNVAVTGKQTYNASATSSQWSLNANFSSSWAYLNGSVVSDVLQVGDSLTARIILEDASQISPWMQDSYWDGTFGMYTSTSTDTGTTLLGQLQSSLDSPVYTLSLDSSCPAGSMNCTGQITLGGLAPDTCQGDSWTELGIEMASYPLPIFNITSLSAVAVGDNCGCTNRVNVPTVAIINNDFGRISTSYQVHDLFVQASGATYNFATDNYELTDAQMARATPVQLNLANGGVLHVNPADYILPSVDQPGTNYLNIYSHYDVHEYKPAGISLNMRLLTHYCLSKNFQTGIWSLGSRV